MSVAVKITRNKKKFHEQALLEVKILEELMKNKHINQGISTNVIRIYGYFYFRGHLCITCELLGLNLYELSKRNNFVGFSSNLVRKLAIQLLRCLSYLKKLKILHCDLKPENILVSSTNNSTIRIIDFGSSCYRGQTIYTYVQSRFYRAPELF